MNRYTYLILFSLFFACQNQNQSEHNNTETIPETPLPDSHQFLKKFEGTIGEYPIEMVLTNWGDGFLNGKYWYKKKGEAIEISGELITENAFEIAEYINDTENGFFVGTIESPHHLKGTWISEDQSKSYDFDLTATKEKSPDDIWSGNWYFNEIWDGGIILMGNYTKDSIDFALSIFRSAHNGIAEGKAYFVQNKAIFYTDLYDEEKGCKLVFEHKGDHILLDQRGSNFGCGFGMRAFAGGRYDNHIIEKKAVLDFGTEEGKVFQTKAQHDNFKALVGNEMYDLFAFNMQNTEPLDINNEDHFATKAIAGFVQGLFTSNEAIIMYDDASNFWAATIDIDDSTDEFVVRYFSNVESNATEIPTTINDWRENFMDYRIVNKLIFQ
ncbi:MAG: hypothetical protein P1U70_12435 [Saprospiraceae bacterium]|jgi:hypothetical protein|nr:hypothetical protein [Saprospiraceae bacterium]